MNQSLSKYVIEKRIYLIRGQRVMVSPHLAELYGVEPRVLIQAVKRNLERFPADFAFQLTWEEAKLLRSQSVILEPGGKGKGRYAKYPPYAFSQEGVAMLSSVLRSPRAIQVNITIMRAFVRLREILSINKELARRFRQLEAKVGKHDEEIQAIFEAIRQLMTVPETAKRRIGFHGS